MNQRGGIRGRKDRRARVIKGVFIHEFRSVHTHKGISLVPTNLQAAGFSIIRSCRRIVVVNRSLSSNASRISPPSHTYPTANRFPQEAFPRPQVSLLPQLEFKSPPYGSHNKRQFHLRHVPSDTGPRPV